MSTLSPSLIILKLNELEDLYDHVNDLLQLTFVAKQQSEKVMETILDGSLRLLDVCGAIREVLVQTRECSTRLQSALRRRFGKIDDVSKAVTVYLNSRRVIKKSVALALKNVKETRIKMGSLDEAHEDISMCDVLGEVKLTTLEVLGSLLLQINGPKEVLLSLSRWFKELKEDGEGLNKFKELDSRLQRLTTSQKKSKCSDKRFVEEVRCQLSEIEMETQDLVEALELMSRKLIKIRVTLLNMYRPLNCQLIL